MIWLKRTIDASNSVGGIPFSPAERQEAVQLVQAHEERLALNTLKLGIAFNAALLLTAPVIIEPSEAKTILVVSSALFLCFDSFCVFLSRYQSRLKHQYFVVAANVGIIGVFSHILTLTNDLGEGAFVVATSSIIALASTLLILSSFSNWLLPVCALYYFMMPALAYPSRPDAPRWLVIYGLALLFSCLIRHSQTTSMRREAVLERRRREAEIRATRVKFQRDLELARDIQDSMAPSAYSELPDGTKIHCMQMKHEKVAGDWMTVRHFPDGSTVLVIADATGKGMQAALVTHAIQSLWATTLDDTVFDAQSWLQLVNRALCRLGEKQTHSATIGITIMKEKKITYWSAGHLPLFLLLGPERAVYFKPLLCRANVLGIRPTLSLASQHIDIAPSLPLRLIMGSDGILTKGTLTLKRDIENLHAAFEQEGPACLASSAAADDKTLIVVERHWVKSQGKLRAS